MPLLKDGRVCDNPWRPVTDDAPLGKGPILVSLARLLKDHNALLARGEPFGVLLKHGTTIEGGDDVAALAPHLADLAVIAIAFPKFRNGRGYSTARILREHMGYQGELRAIGDVQRDQWQFLHRCGINAFEVPQGTDIKTFQTTLKEFTEAYQAPTQKSVFQKRHQKKQ